MSGPRNALSAWSVTRWHVSPSTVDKNLACRGTVACEGLTRYSSTLTGEGVPRNKSTRVQEGLPRYLITGRPAELPENSSKRKPIEVLDHPSTERPVEVFHESRLSGFKDILFNVECRLVLT